MVWLLVLGGVVLLLLGVALHDWTQNRHTIRRNFPLVGRFRDLLEKIGPELRQYIVAGDNDERPFNRDQRRWSRLKGRSSLSPATMYCRSSGPIFSSR